MGRRIEVELTSARDDGSWTWRVAGARQPKGELVGSLLYDGAQVGDVVKAEAEFHVDGIEITEVFAPKKKKERTDLLELKSRPVRDDELVTTQRVSREGRRGGGGRRGDRDGRRGGGGRRDDRDGREGRGRTPRSSEPARPKPKRIRPKRAHRDALLAEVGDEHRPIVEQVLADGMPGVRAAIDKQNAEAKAADKPEIDAAPILAIAEKNLQKARLAEWRDRADAALEIATEVDLRDLRSVVVAGNDLARDPESREVADQLKTALDERVEADHATWLADLDSAVSEGRVVRALRLSSRPVKAGAPLPPELASTLAEQASEAMSSEVGQERWATVLDALAFSPVRGAVTPVGVPPEPKAELLDAVKRLSDRVPTIAAMFGIDPAEVPRSARRRRSSRDRRGKQGGGQPTRSGGKGSSGERSESRPRPGSPTGATEPGVSADAAPTSEPTTNGAAPKSEAPAPEVSEATEATTPEAQTAGDTPAAEAPAASQPPAESAAAADPSPTGADTPGAESAAAPAVVDAPSGTEPEPEPEAATATTDATEPEAATATTDAPEPEPEAATVTEPETPTETPSATTGATEPEPAAVDAPTTDGAPEAPAETPSATIDATEPEPAAVDAPTTDGAPGTSTGTPAVDSAPEAPAADTPAAGDGPSGAVPAEDAPADAAGEERVEEPAERA